MTKMKQGIGKFVNRGSASAKKTYDSFFLYFPSEVARDSNFPFVSGEKVRVIIDNGSIRLEKISRDEVSMEKFRPPKMERLGCGLMEDEYSFHKTLWTWKMDDKGYLIVIKKPPRVTIQK